MSDNFWLNKPNILLDKEHISEIWPTDDLEYPEKLNACTRLILLLALLGYFLTKSIKIPITALITIGVIVMLYKSKAGKKEKSKNIKDIKENFANLSEQYQESREDFIEPTKENPLMNVLLPEIKNNPGRKPAAPSNNEEIEIKINEKASNIGLDKKLFRDLGDSISFDHSMRNFYTMPNTQIPNNQKKFAEFCYGNMPSCKDVENKDRMFC
jgi:hypothetical protein